jgi:hypothetical protein
MRTTMTQRQLTTPKKFGMHGRAKCKSQFFWRLDKLLFIFATQRLPGYSRVTEVRSHLTSFHFGGILYFYCYLLSNTDGPALRQKERARSTCLRSISAARAGIDCYPAFYGTPSLSVKRRGDDVAKTYASTFPFCHPILTLASHPRPGSMACLETVPCSDRPVRLECGDLCH